MKRDTMSPDDTT